MKPRLFKFIFLIFSGIDWQPKQVWSRPVHHHLLCDSSSYYCIFSRLYDRTLPVKMAKDVFFYKQFLNTPPNKLLLLPSTYSKVSVNLHGTRFIPAVHLGWFQASVTTIMKADIEATFRLRCWSDSYTVFFFFWLMWLRHVCKRNTLTSDNLKKKQKTCPQQFSVRYTSQMEPSADMANTHKNRCRFWHRHTDIIDR